MGKVLKNAWKPVGHLAWHMGTQQAGAWENLLNKVEDTVTHLTLPSLASMCVLWHANLCTQHINTKYIQ